MTTRPPARLSPAPSALFGVNLAAGASIAGLAGTAGLWRAQADQLHAGYAPQAS